MAASEPAIDSPQNHAAFRQIGKGFCGSVWVVGRPGRAYALKREDGGPGRSLHKDSEMHMKIEQSLCEIWKQPVSLAVKLNIPHH
ncbi:hypothetical protein Slin14017_G117670 [Septoria linicola]|nr:hypothetical protein Slin14017_G117670 [Septoria linicola]